MFAAWLVRRLWLVLIRSGVKRRQLGRRRGARLQFLHHVPVEGVYGDLDGGDEATPSDAALGAVLVAATQEAAAELSFLGRSDTSVATASSHTSSGAPSPDAADNVAGA